LAAKKTPKSWIELKIIVPEEATEAIADFLFELGATGVVFEDEETIPPEKGSEKIPKEKVRIIAYYLKNDKQLKRLKNLDEYIKTITSIFPRLAGTKPNRKIFREVNWTNSWRKFFKSFKATDSIIVKPHWEKRKAKDGELIIDINPGLAFGTGSHPTTRMCLRQIEAAIEEKLMRPGLMFNPPSVFDVGTGSGILAIAAAKLGAGKIVAADTDERAITAAEENLKLNNLEDDVVLVSGSGDSVTDTYDIVVANIFAEELISIRQILVDRLAPDGTLILSGIPKTSGAEVKFAFIQKSLDFGDVIHEDDWCSLIFRRI
jgi:ribosomal protein L11 methyltransferase